MESLRELLIEELKDLYSAEKQIVKALPKVAKGAMSEELRAVLQEHLEVTKAQITRLDEVFSLLEAKPRAKPCKGMEGLLEEGDEMLQEEAKGLLRDLHLIGAAQRVEHYEMAAYGTAKTIAAKLDQSEAAELLNQTLEEEEEADEKLTKVAEAIYSEVQSAESSEDEGEEEEDEEEAERVPAAPKSVVKKR